MKANELMIGDWVYNTYHEKNIRITPYDFFVHGHDKNGGQYVVGNMLSSGRDLEPIPLTPEILERNGFEKREPYYVISNEFYELEYYPHEARLRWYYIHKDGKEEIIFEANAVSYVHLLQHALKLCGIEKGITI